MAASSDRNPPPFPTAEESEPGLCDMADADSDEGEDIFVSNVGSSFGDTSNKLTCVFRFALSQSQKACIFFYISTDLHSGHPKTLRL